MGTWTERLGRLGDADRALQLAMGTLIDARDLERIFSSRERRWKPGLPLKLLLAGYVGSRNTGADVRVEEMIRQFRHLIGDDNLELSIMSTDLAGSAGYFRSTRQLKLPQLFPKFLHDECPKYDGVVACEGSMFKSKFADALSTMMAGALGMANKEKKLSIGYGAEAGAMTPGLEKFVKNRCKDSLLICRNESSRELLGQMGLRSTGGTDTAWTFDPGPLENGRTLLRDAGWDGKTPVMAICPINPFWWPVKPDLIKYAAHKLGGQYRDEHYQSVYFHRYAATQKEQYRSYIKALGQALKTFLSEYSYYPILVGMEKLDRKACEDLSQELPYKPPQFISDTYDMYDLVALIRNTSLMVSSRFHAIVCSMPAKVPSLGVTMDERIRNLLNDRKHPHLCFNVDDPELADKLLLQLRAVHRDQEQVREETGRAIPPQLYRMGEMGIEFLDEVERVYPEFPRLSRQRTWEQHLPPLATHLTKLLEDYA